MAMDLPDVYVRADAIALAGQHRFLRRTGLRLVLTLLGAALAALGYLWRNGDLEYPTLGAALVLGLALALEIGLFRDRPENEWYDGRAVAESVKTLAWRYAVGGLPFPLGAPDVDAEFNKQVAELLGDAESIAGAIRLEADSITSDLRDLRAGDLETRREGYLRGRVDDQLVWYTRKSEWNRLRARFWKLTLIALEVVGVVAALLKGFGAIKTDVASIATAGIAVGAAWLAVKQHESIARAYSFAANELKSGVSEHIKAAGDEQAWAREVASAEEAISREHTMWRAARITPPRRPHP